MLNYVAYAFVQHLTLRKYFQRISLLLFRDSRQLMSSDNNELNFHNSAVLILHLLIKHTEISFIPTFLISQQLDLGGFLGSLGQLFKTPSRTCDFILVTFPAHFSITFIFRYCFQIILFSDIVLRFNLIKIHVHSCCILLISTKTVQIPSLRYRSSMQTHDANNCSTDSCHFLRIILALCKSPCQRLTVRAVFNHISICPSGQIRLLLATRLLRTSVYWFLQFAPVFNTIPHLLFKIRWIDVWSGIASIYLFAVQCALLSIIRI